LVPGISQQWALYLHKDAIKRIRDVLFRKSLESQHGEHYWEKATCTEFRVNGLFCSILIEVSRRVVVDILNSEDKPRNGVFFIRETCNIWKGCAFGRLGGQDTIFFVEVES
jgi:hypothetical protein